ADVERMIGIDVEVAARADRTAIGRVHLDRFLDEAARFAADADEATLTAFLAFLDAAEVEENGLESGEVAVEKERVQILTVHGAGGGAGGVGGGGGAVGRDGGRAWPGRGARGGGGAVGPAPGRAPGVSPADPKSVDWTRARQLLPAPLRGDHAELPSLELDG